MTTTYDLFEILLASRDENGSLLPAHSYGETVAPGLAITPGLAGDDVPKFTGNWVLTHTSTGRQLNGTTRIAACLPCVRTYAVAVTDTGIDWTQDMEAITKLIAAGGQPVDDLRAAQTELYACGGSNCHAIDGY
jgi:hypothetical protein